MNKRDSRSAPPAYLPRLHRRHRARGLLLALAPMCIPSPATSQVPPGWAVVSNFQSGTSGLGGLTMIHPMTGSTQTITGLPVDLTGPAPAASVQGASCVLTGPGPGELVVGETCPVNDTLHIHVITLAGATVAQVRSYTVGVASFGIGSIDQMAWLGSDLVFSCRGSVLTGMFAGQAIGVLRPTLGPPGTPGTLSVVPLVVPAGTPNALTVDPGTGRAYLGTFTGTMGAFSSNVWELPVPGGTTAPLRLIATHPTAVTNLHWADGRLWYSGISGPATPPTLAAIDVAANPPTLTPMPVGTAASINAFSHDPVTGDALLVDDRFAPTTGTRLLRLTGTTTTTIGTWPGGGTGITLVPSMSTFGAPSPTGCSVNHDWVITPNPGGLPLLGNTAFTFTFAATQGSAPGMVAYSMRRSNVIVPGIGITLWIDPVGAVGGGFLAAAGQHQINFPIPANPLLNGQTVHVQGFLLPSLNPVCATRGLSISAF